MSLQELLRKFGIQIKNAKIINQAFIHRSYLNEVKKIGELKSNERLEFLGDCVLSFIISLYLFQKRPVDNEGDLTNLRAYIVKTKSLALVSSKLNLGSFLLLSKGEELSGGRTNNQLLANTYEAFLGAIFLDQGIDGAENFVYQTLLPLFENEITKGPPKDAKSRLQELIQQTSKDSPKYRIIQTKGPDHAKVFEVAVFVQGKEVGKGQGPSKQEAEEKAARQALEKLN